MSFPHSYYWSWQKRVFDLTVAVGLLVVCAAPLALISLLLLIFNGFPILYWQKRLGAKQKPFWLVKFRTMRPHAEQLKHHYQELNQAPAPMFKAKNDPRFVWWGRWLSRSGLDELPQIWNILKGEMSLVGPRPLPISEAKQLPETWEFRYGVRPGIISEWAVNSQRYSSLEKWRTLDKQTLQRGGWRYDLGLMVRTAKMLIFG